MVVRIGGKQMYLWRAVDREGQILDMLVQPRRDQSAALKALSSWREPSRVRALFVLASKPNLR